MRLKLIALIVYSLLFACAAPLATPQMSSPPRAPQGIGSTQQPGPRDQENGAEEEQRQKMEKDMAKKANQARQAQLKRDTDQLLKLATDLKAEVDKSNENVLSLNVIKKAEEIEKLAHSVKDKMKGE